MGGTYEAFLRTAGTAATAVILPRGVLVLLETNKMVSSSINFIIYYYVSQHQFNN
jgi:hypothetical protein